MLGNRGASLTTESSAAFLSAEDASPDSPHSKPKHSGGTTFTPLKGDVSLLITSLTGFRYNVRKICVCEHGSKRCRSLSPSVI